MDRMSRRRLLGTLGAVMVGAPLLAACGGGSAAGPAATAAARAQALANSASSAVASNQTSATASTAAASTATTASSTTAAASSTGSAASSTVVAVSAAPGAAQTPLSVAVWADSVRSWPKLYAQKWAAQHPEVKLTIVEIPYGDIEQKTLVEIAANSLQDVVFTQCKSLPKLAYDGAYLALDPMVSQKGSPVTLSNYFPASITNSTLDGKLYGLPYELNTGNEDVIFYNADLLEKAGAATPTDTWTFDEFLQTAQKTNDPQHHVWGTNLFMQTYYDFDTYVRTNGGELLVDQGKTFQLATNPICKQTAQWMYDLAAKYKVAPTREAAQNLSFPAGQVALSAGGVQSFAGLKASIADKFKWDVVLAPVASDGRRGYELFSTIWSIYSKTKQPELAWNLLAYENSADTQTWSMVNQGQPPTLISVWEGKEAAAISPIYRRVAEWLKDPKDGGPFPEPYNFKFAELQDKWQNVSYSLWYGQEPFESGLQQVQQACQAICSAPR